MLSILLVFEADGNRTLIIGSLEELNLAWTNSILEEFPKGD
jgi:hypothetical protein